MRKVDRRPGREERRERREGKRGAGGRAGWGWGGGGGGEGSSNTMERVTSGGAGCGGGIWPSVRAGAAEPDGPAPPLATVNGRTQEAIEVL